jgi:hypothetical protein
MPAPDQLEPQAFERGPMGFYHVPRASELQPPCHTDSGMSAGAAYADQPIAPLDPLENGIGAMPPIVMSVFRDA